MLLIERSVSSDGFDLQDLDTSSLGVVDQISHQLRCVAFVLMCRIDSQVSYTVAVKYDGTDHDGVLIESVDGQFAFLVFLQDLGVLFRSF